MFLACATPSAVPAVAHVPQFDLVFVYMPNELPDSTLFSQLIYVLATFLHMPQFNYTVLSDQKHYSIPLLGAGDFDKENSNRKVLKGH